MSVKVSIIIPAFNVEAYIERCFESLLQQSMQDFEIICVDDASEDGTFGVMHKYSQKYDNIYVQKNTVNKGAGITRNIGLREAKGEYVIFLDSDDTYHLQLLEKMYEAITSANADVAICKADCQDAQGNIVYSKSGWDVNLISKDYITTADNRQHLLQGILYAPWNKLVRREFLLENDILFQDLPNTNDVYYSIMLEACAKKIVFIDEALILYKYERAGSLTEGRLQRRSYITWAFEEVIIQLRKRNMWHGDIRKSAINLILDTCYRYVADVTDIFSKQCLADYRERIMPLLSEEEVRQDAFTKWEYYEYEYLNGKCRFCENTYQLLAKELASFLETQVSGGIALWGAGKLGREFMEAVANNGIYIQYIVDNNPDKQGKSLCGVEICSYEDVKDKIGKYLVLNERYIEEIKQQVGHAGKVINMKGIMEEFL